MMAGGVLLTKELAPFAVMRCRKGEIMIYFDNSATTKIAPEAYNHMFKQASVFGEILQAYIDLEDKPFKY